MNDEERLRELREKHVVIKRPDDDPYCNRCGIDWPCDVVFLLGVIDEQTKALQAVIDVAQEMERKDE